MEEFTTEGINKELAKGHISARESLIKGLKAKKKEIIKEGGKDRKEELSTIFDDTIKRIGEEIVELKKVK